LLVGAAEGLKGLDFAVVFAVEASFESLLEIRGQGLLAEGTGGSCGLGVVGVAVAHPVGGTKFGHEARVLAFNAADDRFSKNRLIWGVNLDVIKRGALGCATVVSEPVLRDKRLKVMVYCRGLGKHVVGELLFAASYTVKRERHFRAKVLSGTPALFFKR
jgi:hypothetical protein